MTGSLRQHGQSLRSLKNEKKTKKIRTFDKLSIAFVSHVNSPRKYFDSQLILFGAIEIVQIRNSFVKLLQLQVLLPTLQINQQRKANKLKKKNERK
jgi:hypothetical protein